MIRGAILITIACSACFYTLQAQDLKKDSLQALAEGRMPDAYGVTGNMAFLAATDRPQYGYARAALETLSGDFRRPMEPSGRTVYGVGTGGLKKVNGWTYTADFRYRKTNDRGLAWSAVNDAYNGNPFIWADSSTGNWQRDHIDVRVGVATSFGKKLQAGWQVDYNIGSGARTSEPKPFYRMRDIALAPGVTWRLSETSVAGAVVKARFTQEENEIGYYSRQNVLLYRLLGYGTFSKSPFVSGERKNTGHIWEGKLHYLKRWKAYTLLVHAFASQNEEKVTEGVAVVKESGYFTEIGMGGGVQLLKGSIRSGNAVRLAYQKTDGYADDVIFRAESASFSRHQLQGSLAWWWHGKSQKQLWHWELAPAFTYLDYADNATRMQFTSTVAGAMLRCRWQCALNSKLRLQVVPFGGYYQVIDSSFSVATWKETHRTLVVPDYHYFSTSYGCIGGHLSLQLQPKDAAYLHTISLRGEMRSTNAYFSNRTQLQFYYTILF